MNLRPTLYLILGGSLAASLYLAWNAKDSSPENVQKPATAARQTITRATPQALEAAVPVKKGSTNAKTALEELKELAHSATPEDSFKRYQILAACLKNEQNLKALNELPINQENRSFIDIHKPSYVEIQKRCEGISFTDISHRFDLLNLAVRANVPGAASAFFEEGPFGDINAIEARPSDPNVIQWKKQAIEQLENAAQNCDQLAVSDLTQVYHYNVTTEKDPAKELLYLTFGYELRRRKIPQSVENYIAKLRASLSKSNMDEVNAQIKYLSQRCKLHP